MQGPCAFKNLRSHKVRVLHVIVIAGTVNQLVASGRQTQCQEAAKDGANVKGDGLTRLRAFQLTTYSEMTGT